MSLNDFKKVIKKKSIPLSLKGYNIKEVDKYINDLLDYCEKILQENKKYKEELIDYQEKDQYLKNVLIHAERFAKEILGEAENKANKIVEDAKTNSESIVSNAMGKKEQELNDLRLRKKEYDKLFSRYIQEERAVLDSFFILSRKYVDALKDEFLKEVLNSLERLDKEFKELDPPSIKEGERIDKDFFAKGDAFFVGREVKNNIQDQDGQVFITKGTVITPELVKEAIARGFYGELVAALADEEEG